MPDVPHVAQRSRKTPFHLRDKVKAEIDKLVQQDIIEKVNASEIFQEAIRQVIENIEGARNISDDILVYGRNRKEHDIALQKVLQMLSDSGLTLNGPKYEFRKDKITFFGVVFGAQGEYLLVIIDEYSRYPVIEITRSVSANMTIPVLDKVLSLFGPPKIVKSDNGSPFNSEQFRRYAESMGFDQRRVTPRCPRANAQAEAFSKPLMKVVRAATLENRN
ncbi:uncharacterized protein K02A2.6-like [Mizuhopecten yessoensis]|uniref:uncharacterized protein K02A2.6-like n=1 Tax=Mizuhopecten yessoensis TaxID=6573 RepID=UPI000B45B597|nr:uncharacterized protein K02A2.6-like [Mizuhopecten yessoensis]